MTSAKSYFQSKKRHTLIAIGYWHSIFEPEFPDPAWFVDEEWDEKERNLVIAHLQNSRSLSDWTGQSWCRFRCGETKMGSKDLTDHVYIFPEGLVHYLQTHMVRLPEAFIKHVSHYQPVEINVGLENCNIEFNWWANQKGWNRDKQSYPAPNDDIIESYRQIKK